MSSPDIPQSAFGRFLAENPEKAAYYEAMVRELRAAARKDLLAVERSEQLTAEDFAIVINARTEDMFR